MALFLVGLYAFSSPRARITKPIAHFVRAHMREGNPVKPHMRGVGKPSLVFTTVLFALWITSMVIAAAATR